MTGSAGARPRLLPALIVALGALGALKSLGLVTLGGFMLLPLPGASAQDTGPASFDAAGRLREQRLNLSPPKVDEDQTTQAIAKPSEGRPVDLSSAEQRPSPAELEVLESLRKRREALDARAEELELRENLLAAAQKRVEEKIAELKQLEADIAARLQERQSEESEQIDGVVSMYKNMKAKDAARIFDRLDFNTLLGVARRIQPRVLAPILASMDPDIAGALTVYLADLARTAGPNGPDDQELMAVAGQ